MKITLLGPSDLELSEFHLEGLAIDSATQEAHFSALEMFATSLALCSGSVLVSYGQHLDIPEHDLALRVMWEYAENPLRVSQMALELRWPSLPASRRHAAERAAEQCTVHHTLHHPPHLTTRFVETTNTRAT